MTEAKRYREEEVAEILDLAVSGEVTSDRGSASAGGLTLAEVQAIGHEAGIEPDRIALAAQALEARRGLLPRRRFLGMPISVGRTVDLPRALTDREWEIVVADLRDTFAAAGQVGSQGGAREWRNGNLRVLLEPTEEGHRLRMSTLNARLRSLGSIGAALLVTSLVFLTILVPEMLSTSGATLRALAQLLPTLIVGVAGAGALAWNRISLPRWAGEREAQMEQIGARARSLAEPSPTSSPAESD